MIGCDVQENAFNMAVQGFGDALKSRTDGVSQDVQNELEDKQEEWDKKGDITFKFDVTFETTSILIPVVEITMREKRWVYDVPQVTMKQRDIIFGAPEVTMVLKKTGQYPEIFSEDTWISLPFGGKTKGIPKITIRWRDIMTKVPVVRMVNKKISLHIPEFEIDQTETIIGIPEFTVSQKEIKLDLPQFKLTDVILNSGGAKDDAESIKKEADAFAAEAKARIERAVAEAKEEEKFPVIRTASEYFGCIRDDIMGKRESIQIMFQGLIDQSSAVLKSLTDAGADGTPEAQEVRNSLARTSAQLEDALDQIDTAIAELNKSEEEQIQKIVGSP